jgi:hypothetical protein
MSSSGERIGSAITSGIEGSAGILLLLGAHSRISLRGSNTRVHLRKSQGGQCEIQDIGCLLLIQRD